MKKRKTVLSCGLEETSRIADEFVEKLFTTGGKTGGKAVVVLLQGDLGSGKTTFVKAVAKKLGIRNTVTSPTFVLEKIYAIPRNAKKETGFQQLIHIDAYRLSDKDDLWTIGWEEIVKDPKNLIFIEWPERVSEVFLENTPKISFEFVDENTRNLTFCF
ncbi:MAG: tRNA (adenosine(37)-N6)-threonylcarbamoyltransferase complex ATPase subunit type 1 TsaE [Candidatus Paceibacterota bacterium]|jgi:tRNA threonylcarbamoyladenosine biosynthesis protein TsaE